MDDETRSDPTAAPGVPVPRRKKKYQALTGTPSVTDVVEARQDPRSLTETRDDLAKTYALLLLKPAVQRNIEEILRRKDAKDVVQMLRTLRDFVLPEDGAKGGGTRVNFINATVPRPGTGPLDVTPPKGTA